MSSSNPIVTGEELIAHIQASLEEAVKTAAEPLIAALIADVEKQVRLLHTLLRCRAMPGAGRPEIPDDGIEVDDLPPSSFFLPSKRINRSAVHPHLDDIRISQRSEFATAFELEMIARRGMSVAGALPDVQLAVGHDQRDRLDFSGEFHPS